MCPCFGCVRSEMEKSMFLHQFILSFICFVDSNQMKQQKHFEKFQTAAVSVSREQRGSRICREDFEGKERGRVCFHVRRETEIHSAEIKDTEAPLHTFFFAFWFGRKSIKFLTPPWKVEFTSHRLLRSRPPAAWTSVGIWSVKRTEFKFASSQSKPIVSFTFDLPLASHCFVFFQRHFKNRFLYNYVCGLFSLCKLTLKWCRSCRQLKPIYLIKDIIVLFPVGEIQVLERHEMITFGKVTDIEDDQYKKGRKEYNIYIIKAV